jgi:hypothetical protein
VDRRHRHLFRTTVVGGLFDDSLVFGAVVLVVVVVVVVVVSLVCEGSIFANETWMSAGVRVASFMTARGLFATVLPPLAPAVVVVVMDEVQQPPSPSLPPSSILEAAVAADPSSSPPPPAATAVVVVDEPRTVEEETTTADRCSPCRKSLRNTKVRPENLTTQTLSLTCHIARYTHIASLLLVHATRQRRRRSRCCQTIRLGDPASLHFRRLCELFSDPQQPQQQQTEHDDDEDDNPEEAVAVAPEGPLLASDPTTLSSTQATVTSTTHTTPALFLRFHHLTLQRLHQSPNIYWIENFLSSTELSHLLKLIGSEHNDVGMVKTTTTNKPKKRPRHLQFEKSFVGEDSHVDVEQRTSTFLNLSKQHDKIVSNIETKAANLLGCYSAAKSVEPLQLVRYKKGQFFGIHHDLGDYDDETQTVIPPPRSLYCRRRLVTIFCYLNTLASNTTTQDEARTTSSSGDDVGDNGGGTTDFPALGLSITPKAGAAVIFPNVLVPSGLPDVRTIHAGRPPTQPNIKYGLNIWICED